jgi:hypothetical protein
MQKDSRILTLRWSWAVYAVTRGVKKAHEMGTSHDISGCITNRLISRLARVVAASRQSLLEYRDSEV